MMPAGKLTRVIVANTIRSPRHFILSAFGIVIGIASFVFFLGLSMGVRNVILGKIFPLERVEVVAPRASLLGVDVSKKLDDSTVELIRGRREVKQALPRMSMVFPAAGLGNFDGVPLNFEVGGFADSIDPEFLAGDRLAPLFKDWEAEDDPNRVPCKPAPGPACAPSDRYYCDQRDNMCHHRVPAIVSPTLLELYNGQFAKSQGLPIIGEFEQFVLERGGLSRMSFKIVLGSSTISGSTRTVREQDQLQVEAMLIGISDRAMPIGITVPIQYMRKWNKEFGGEGADTTYSSIIVTLADKDRLAPFSAWLTEEAGLRLEDSLGERFATAIFIVTTLFVLISFVIVLISAINIAHNFFMQVSERRREIGILRAVGATRTDVRLIILGESALIGLIGGGIGVAIALGAAFTVDWMSATWLPRFPFKPPTYFDFQPWIIIGGLVFSTLFCVFGGYLPARRASKMQPAQALAAQ